ncbi:uncharacterized protein LOC114537965 [Dendronephthya gigantea]|uniref:uncharacterized protein LOC114537965 n=1 Tax=Dendronephthya gigantea TaxID=151771 RepID=UPI00106ACB1B|nr:uncharacterized protein LOC114537965 [Dendronephthya gigantea]
MAESVACNFINIPVYEAIASWIETASLPIVLLGAKGVEKTTTLIMLHESCKRPKHYFYRNRGRLVCAVSRYGLVGLLKKFRINYSDLNTQVVNPTEEVAWSLLRRSNNEMISDPANERMLSTSIFPLMFPFGTKRLNYSSKSTSKVKAMFADTFLKHSYFRTLLV